MPHITMTRLLQFSAAHQNWEDNLTEAQNLEVFGLDASPHPAGYTYTLEVSVSGYTDHKTGLLLNIKEIDHLVRETITLPLNGKSINFELPEFFLHPVTPETLTVYVVNEIIPRLPSNITLTKVSLSPLPNLQVQWESLECQFERGKAPMLLTRKYEFSASHRLHSTALSNEENQNLFGKCNNPNGHGHNYELEVTVSGPIDSKSGRIISLDQLDEIVNSQVVDRYDHRHLNLDIPEFAELIPTSENIIRVIWDRVSPALAEPIRLHTIKLRETARNFFEYSGEESDSHEK